MNLRSVISNRVGRCPICDSPWGEGGEIWTGEGLTGWYCSPSCVGTAVERATSPNRAQNVVQRYAEPSRPVYAPNAKETAFQDSLKRQDARSAAISIAHEENIAASKRLAEVFERIATVLERVYPPGGAA